MLPRLMLPRPWEEERARAIKAKEARTVQLELIRSTLSPPDFVSTRSLSRTMETKESDLKANTWTKKR